MATNNGWGPGAPPCTHRTSVLRRLTNPGFNNQTLRQIVHTSVGGDQVRVRLSTFGASALVIGAAHIALRDVGAAIVPGSDRTLTFSGQPSITIPPGALVLSDPVDLDVPALSDLAVSIFVPGSTGPATWHFEALQTSYVSPPGDFTASADMPVDSHRTHGAHDAWFWLAGVEVMASKQTGAIVTFGDSVTDGTQVYPGHQQPVAGPPRPAAHVSAGQSQDGRAEPRNHRQPAP